MRFIVQLILMSDQGEVLATNDVATLEKTTGAVEDIGLSLSESKTILHGLQEGMVQAQIESYLEDVRRCTDCGRPARAKDCDLAPFRTLFGNIRVRNPRYCRCRCRTSGPKTWRPLHRLLTEESAPELQLIETKWASLAPYTPVVELLKDVLPVDPKLSPQAVKNTVMAIGRRCDEDRLAPRKRGECSAVVETVSDDPTIIAMDSGYLKPWQSRNKKFEVIVGKVSSEHGGDRCFGFLVPMEPHPGVRSLEALQPHGIDESSEVYWLSDGEEGLRRYQWPFSRDATFILDWFHLAMRFQWLEQLARGAASLGVDQGRTVHKEIAHAKWSLWHGNHWEAKLYLDTLDIGDLPEDHPKVKRIWEVAKDLSSYLADNEDMLVDYGALYREDRPISTAPVESAVNYLVKKRMSKKQQMGWTPEGAHSMLQVRAQTLNEEIEDTFRRWYPGLAAA